jgi:hypothetical protein
LSNLRRLQNGLELELRKRFIARGIPLQLGPVDEADEQAEIDAMRICIH